MLRYLLCDFDGTLVDSEAMHIEAWRLTLEPLGVWMGREILLSRYAGRSFESCSNQIVQDYQLKLTPEELDWYRQSHYQELMADVALPKLPGASDFLQTLSSLCPLALVTGSSLKEIEPTINAYGWQTYFDCIVTRDDVEAPKPAGDSYLRAYELLHADPSECLAIEDSLTGLNAASAAGIRALLISDGEVPVHEGHLIESIAQDLAEAKATVLKILAEQGTQE